MNTTSRIPMSLITGFLGSGKTTLLRRLIESQQECETLRDCPHFARDNTETRDCKDVEDGHSMAKWGLSLSPRAAHTPSQKSRRIIYVINEFGAVDVDGRTLNLQEGEWISIPGGSIFCTCLTGEFIRHLGSIPEAFKADDRPVEGVLIEASGIADPRVVARMLAETRLDQTYELRRVITVVDPGTFPKLLKTLPNITAQVEACDLALLNKIDLYSESQIASAQDTLRRLNPEAQIIRSSYGHARFDPWDRGCPVETHGDYAPCADPHFERLVIRIEHPFDVVALRHELQAIQPSVFRIKGWVDTPLGTYQVDVSAGGVAVREIRQTGIPASEPSLLVCIFPPRSLAAVEAFGIRCMSGRSISAALALTE